MVTVHGPYSAKSKLHEMQFCETCRRQNALKMHFVCIAKRVAVNGVNSNPLAYFAQMAGDKILADRTIVCYTISV